MKNKRSLIGIVLLNVVLIAALLCVLLLLDHNRHKPSDGIQSKKAAGSENVIVGPKEHAPGSEVSEDKKDLEDPESSEKTQKELESSERAQKDPESSEKARKDPESSEKARKDAWIAEKLASMTIEEKVAQLFMLSPEKLTGVSHVTAAGKVTKKAIDAFPVGGVIYFGANIETPQQVTEMIAKTKHYALDRIDIPMFIAVDEEGGQVTRIAKNGNFDVPTFPCADELGRSGEVNAAYEMGSAIGAYLGSYGFNVDLAPVADVLSNPENKVVEHRSFGSDAQLVSDMVLAELDGLKSNDIIGCVKHFPGHGATAGDTHEGYAYTEKTWEELLADEIVPFSNSIAKGVPMIMVGHISLPNVVGDHTPASMSYCMITEHLRDELGYDGIVITDSLGMGAITESYDPKQAAVNVLNAGGDMLLDPADVKSAYEGILAEIASGGISEERIDESVCRILNVKYGLLKK